MTRAARLAQEAPAGIDEAVTLDRLAGDWRIYQLAAGHRFSVDDTLVAWMASRVAPGAGRVLDLGAGIGSVGLITLWKLLRCGAEACHVTMVEAQEQSQRLCRATVALNRVADRATLILGDLRDANVVAGEYDLVTGSPPYFPVGTGKISPHAQKAACRMELRGTIADYARAAAPRLAPDGWFVACFPARDPRGDAAFAPAGLAVHATCDVVFREGMPPMIRLFAARLADPRSRPVVTRPWPTLTLRDRAGAWSPTYQDIRREMGIDPAGER